MLVLAKYLSEHPVMLAAVSSFLTYVANVVVTALVTNLPAPTKDSTVKYVYWFRVANTIVGSFTRAANSHVENSPNWHDAFEKRTTANGGAPVPPLIS